MRERKPVDGQAGNQSGAWGETVAQAYLRDKGYTILATNFRTRLGEIDIISSDAQYIVFVEVKTRRSCAFGLPCEAVTRSKQQKILLAAQEWLQQHPSPLQPRFDVVEVYGQPPGSRQSKSSGPAAAPPFCHHIEDAFEGD